MFFRAPEIPLIECVVRPRDIKGIFPSLPLGKSCLGSKKGCEKMWKLPLLSFGPFFCDLFVQLRVTKRGRKGQREIKLVQAASWDRMCFFS